VDAAEYERMFHLEDDLWWYRALHSRTLAAARRCLSDVEHARILDAGCGTGGMAHRLSALGQVTALDVSPVALCYAVRRSLQRIGCATVDRLPVHSESFDLVVSLDVLCHAAVADERAAMVEMARALRSGGHLLINLPAFPALLSRHDRQVQNVRRFRRGRVRRLLEDAGLQPVELTYWNTALFPAAALVRWIRRNQLGGASELAQPPGWLNGILERLLAAEHAANRHVSLPFGLSIFAVAVKAAAPGCAR
jgi:SAM-dependent methyltransferase